MQFRRLCFLALASASSCTLLAAEPRVLHRDPENESIANEVELARTKGFERLTALQKTDGAWGGEDDAVWTTAVALIACGTEAERGEGSGMTETRKKGQA